MKAFKQIMLLLAVTIAALHAHIESFGWAIFFSLLSIDLMINKVREEL